MHRQVARFSLVGFLVLPLITPVPVWSAALSMGTARGVGSVELSLENGKNWLSVGSRSLPILDGTQLRTSNGGVVIDMSDGSRLNVLPFSFVRLREAAGTTQVSLVHGRLSFHLPRAARVEIRTPAIRLEPVRTEVMRGEIFVAREGTMGLKMAAGSLQVHELAAGGRHVWLAGLEPVFLPKRPDTAAPLFTSEVPASPPAGTKAVFDPRGRSLGYLHHDAQLVVHPGYTSDLTAPFAPKLVHLAMAKIPEKDRSDAMPVFDLNGSYEGYVAGPVFYAQAQVAEAVAGEPPATILGMEPLTFYALAGSLGAVAGVSAAGAAGAFGGGRAATPTGPSR
jgi:hypothetical protein